jgi:mannose-6-phosphate isomerase-like protein (cupin superfamily)
LKPTRRVVTGHDPAGRAAVLFDGPAPNCKLRKASGLVSTLLWLTDESPADVSRALDAAQREIGVAPPPAGSIFRVVDFPPTQGEISSHAVLKEMGLDGEQGAPASRHPLMHRTPSIDYAVVLEGEIDMLLDDSEVHLQAGDVLVQQGTNHAWVNRGIQPCRIAFVLIGSTISPGGA